MNSGVSKSGTRPSLEKRCPECAESIKATAKLCRHCGWRSVTLTRPGRCKCGGIFMEEEPSIWIGIVGGLLGGLLFSLFRGRKCSRCGAKARS